MSAYTASRTIGCANSRLSPGFKDRDRRQQIGGIDRLVLPERCQSSGLGEGGAVAEHRDRANEGGRRRGPVGETQEHRLGDRGGPDAAHPGRLARIGRQPLLAHLAQERLEEERVAAGGLAAGRHELGRHVLAQPALAQRRGRPGAQRPRSQDGRLGTGGQPSQVRA